MHFDNMPMHAALALFHYGQIVDGQENSTRYQKKFKESSLSPLKLHFPPHQYKAVKHLEGAYQDYFERSIAKFNKHEEIARSRFTEMFKPQDKKETSALEARVLDTARAFLLLGQRTGFAIGTSARDWSRFLSYAKVMDDPYYHAFASQLQAHLAPSEEVERDLDFKARAPALIRHTEGNATAIDNLEKVREWVAKHPKHYLLARASWQGVGAQRPLRTTMISRDLTEGDRMAAQYIAASTPQVPVYYALAWVAKNLSDDDKRELGRLMHQGHDHLREMPHLADVSGISFIFNGAVSEVRDFNRHRPWGRYIDSLGLTNSLPLDFEFAKGLSALGFTLPAYVSEIPEWRKEMATDMREMHERREKLLDYFSTALGRDGNFSFMRNLVHLGDTVPFVMHGNPKQASFMLKQRYRGSGHINYRIAAFDANQLYAASSPYFETERFVARPDPLNRAEFFNRA